jgi:hypothetical protein
MLTPTVANILKTRYPGDALTIGQQDFMRTLNRETVTPPWVGGMKLTGLCSASDCIAADCSSNFTAYDFATGFQTYYVLTAGHCFLDTSQVTNGVGLRVGMVVQRFWADGINADVELVQIDPGTQSPNIITHDPTRQGVVGASGTQVTGISVCKSGITTNETCSWTVSQDHQTITICVSGDNPCSQTVTTYDQVVATSPSPAVGPGDSGGPVYSFQSGNLWGEGIVSAGNKAGTTMVYSYLADELSETQTYLCTTGVC